jgi:hypothetical protein
MAYKVAQDLNGQRAGATYSGPAALLPFYLVHGYVYDDAAKAKVTGSANAVNIVTGGNLVLKVNGVTVTAALATSDTPAAAATKIDTAMGANGDAAIVSSKLELTSNSTASAPRTVEVVSGTGTVLANLGLAVGQKGTTEQANNTDTVPANDPTLAVNREDPGDAFQFGTDATLAPRVRTLSPNHGDIAGGTAVIADGDNFTGVTAVTVGGVATTAFSVVSDNEIHFTTGAHAAGAVDVLFDKGSLDTTVTGGFTYADETP